MNVLLLYSKVSFHTELNTQPDGDSYSREPAALIFLGNSSCFILNQILLQQTKLGISVVFTPESSKSLFPLKQLSNPLGNETFMKRYMLIEKAKKCEVFGIIVVNSWVHRGGRQAIKALLDMLQRNKKRGYVFTMSNPL